MNNFQSLAATVRALVDAGAQRIFAKAMAPNDNSKNQVYLASGFGILNVIPAKTPAPSISGRYPTFWSSVDFAWLSPDGSLSPAPGAKIILYPQYPEVRLSGFMMGSDSAPAEWLSPDRQGRAKGRVLFLGIKQNRQVVAVLAPPGSPAAVEWLAGRDPSQSKTIEEIGTGPASSCNRLLHLLRKVYNAGWIDSKSLDSGGSIKPCMSPNCAGYTLEAELGIPKNGQAGPDLLGWELKTMLGSRLDAPLGSKSVTLFTPEPTGGLYRTLGVGEFVRRFGYPDRKGREDRLNFGGVFRVGQRSELTGLGLALTGYDAGAGKIRDPNGSIDLISIDGDVAASWSFSSLLGHWGRKHSAAAYVPAVKHNLLWKYRYGNLIALATGTDFLAFVQAVANGLIVYDPGIKLEGATSEKPRVKRRSQFRIAAKDLHTLYKSMQVHDLTAG